MNSCEREIRNGIANREPKTPLGSASHANLQYCGFLDSVNAPEDQRHCNYLGKLELVDSQPRYLCRAFEEMKKAGLTD